MNSTGKVESRELRVESSEVGIRRSELHSPNFRFPLSAFGFGLSDSQLSTLNSRLVLCLVLSLFWLASGCYTTHRAIDDAAVTMQNRLFATSAWHEYGPESGEVEHRGHFKDGFKAGYAAVASGRNGDPPALPPQKYWSVFYRNHEGQEKMLAWFNGYACGAFAAENEGVAARNHMVTFGAIDQNAAGDTSQPGEGE